MTQAFNWALDGVSKLLRRDADENDAASLREAFSFLDACLPDGPTKLQMRRHAVAATAVATSQDAQWKAHIKDALAARRHFEVHCLLQSHWSNGALRRLYGTQIEPVTPREAFDRSVPWNRVRGVWCWPHFTPQEMACNGSGRLYVEPELLDKLEKLRRVNGDRGLNLTSGYRSPAHNAQVPGAAARSPHMLGQAADIKIGVLDPIQLIESVERVGFAGIGEYANAATPRVHVDVRPEGVWRDAPEGKFRANVDYAARADDERVSAPAKDNVEGAVKGGAVAFLYYLWTVFQEYMQGAQEFLDILMRTVGDYALPMVTFSIAGVVLIQNRRKILYYAVTRWLQS